jgi:hypothetical protein
MIYRTLKKKRVVVLYGIVMVAGICAASILLWFLGVTK